MHSNSLRCFQRMATRLRLPAGVTMRAASCTPLTGGAADPVQSMFFMPSLRNWSILLFQRTASRSSLLQAAVPICAVKIWEASNDMTSCCSMPMVVVSPVSSFRPPTAARNGELLDRHFPPAANESGISTTKGVAVNAVNARRPRLRWYQSNWTAPIEKSICSFATLRKP